MSGGFKSPLFLLGLSSVAAPPAGGGFVTPIPVLNIGGVAVPIQAGFITPIPVLNMGGPGLSPVTPVTGGGFGYEYKGTLLKQLRQEDEEIIVVLAAFMESIE